MICATQIRCSRVSRSVRLPFTLTLAALSRLMNIALAVTVSLSLLKPPCAWGDNPQDPFNLNVTDVAQFQGLSGFQLRLAVVSPNHRRVAVALRRDGSEILLLNGNQLGSAYDKIHDRSISFSTNSDSVIFSATKGTFDYLVTDGVEQRLAGRVYRGMSANPQFLGDTPRPIVFVVANSKVSAVVGKK